jgi:two-component system response regulator FixJ
VFIVDDDDAVRDSLDLLLDTMGYATESFASGVEFLDACDVDWRGCVLLDVRMPKMDGLQVQAHLHKDYPMLRVVMITGHGDITMAEQAKKAGALDFLEKPFDEESLLESVENALSDMDRAGQRRDMHLAAIRSLETLAPREREVLDQLVIGHPNKVIAFELDCSPRTVEIHRARIMEKMTARSLPHLVRLALAAGIDPDC